MKVMKVCLLLAAFVVMTGVASAQAIWWDNDSTDGLWVTGINWNEGDFVEIPEVLEVLGDDPSTTDVVETDFVLVPFQPAIPGYGNDIGPVLGQAVDLRNIETTTTNVGEAGPININIGAGDVAQSGKLWISSDSFSSDAVTVTVDGGSLETDGGISLGHYAGDVGVLNLVSGSIDLNVAGEAGNLEVGAGQDGDFTGGTGTFTMAAGTTLTVGNGKDIEVSNEANTNGTFIAVGDYNAATLDIDVADNFRVAGRDRNNTSSVGTATLTGIEMEVGNTMDFGRYGQATVTLTDTNITFTNGGKDITVGRGGTANDGSSGNTGVLTLTDSVITHQDGMYKQDDLLVAENSGGTGTLTLNGASSMDFHDDMIFGKHGTGYLNINDTSYLGTDKDDLELGQKSGGVGIMTMTGGTVDIGDALEMSKGDPGDAGTSTLNMSGGVINIDGRMKMAQCGGEATVNMTGGLINVGDSLSVSYLDTSKDMTGTVGHLTLGDGSNGAIVLGDATIDAAKFSMAAAYDSTDGDGNPVAVDAWVDFQPGGLLLIDDDVTEMIATLIADNLLRTTYTGDYFGTLAAGESIGVTFDFDDTSAAQTAVYLGVIPEPATMLLLGLGGLLIRRRR
ncbi:MAG: PEP-CTERM sorting domain-containing protein [Planctomycetes bacterium]|nr:PEP-CTERM sorting domain-containing protein [Planctomycetota bacterium]